MTFILQRCNLNVLALCPHNHPIYHIFVICVSGDAVKMKRLKRRERQRETFCFWKIVAGRKCVFLLLSVEQLGSSKPLALKLLIENMKGVKLREASERLRMWWEPVILGWLGIWWPCWRRASTKITAAASKKMSSFLSLLTQTPAPLWAHVVLMPSFSCPLSFITKYRKGEYSGFWSLSGAGKFADTWVRLRFQGKEIWDNTSKDLFLASNLFLASSLSKSWH